MAISSPHPHISPLCLLSLNSSPNMSSSGPSSSATISAVASSSALPSTYSSFQPPSTLHLPPNSIAIEYCDRCRWQHRASWTQTELLITFGPKPAPSPGQEEEKGGKYGSASLSCVAILPKVEEDSAGRFRVWVYHRPNEGQGAGEDVKATCIYDRKTMGRFPEMKELVSSASDFSPHASGQAS